LNPDATIESQGQWTTQYHSFPGFIALAHRTILEDFGDGEGDIEQPDGLDEDDHPLQSSAFV